MFECTCRGALIKPWIFTEIKEQRSVLQSYAIDNYIAYNKTDVAIISALIRFYLAKAVLQAD